ncbi:hypothetical protein GCM10010260_20610 [Streptomyces filipinensis]|uniref:Secreted protein n=1 Tax=Streptomyces filipinensis TaxID=66887 RepID=A0A918I822_9ACTN|nr:hypothetical protein [Streptomyces filipinensis]GGU87158.1 hypothetical protein GCM10010260_20610 [Streptomyces filipinensis]
MFRGTTARTRFPLIAVLLLALQLFAPTGTFAPAHTLSQAQAKAESGIASSAPPVHEEKDSVRTPNRSGAPLSAPHLRDRQRGPASGWAQQPALIAGRASGADAPDAPGAPYHRAARTPRALTPAALQVFRC